MSNTDQSEKQGMPVHLNTLVAWLDRQFAKIEVEDSPRALNGLQVESTAPVDGILCAVDACEAVFEMASAHPRSLILVHHGMFWCGTRPVTGAHFRKLARLISSESALYSMHLPLDAHPTLGNNALLADALGLHTRRPWFPIEGSTPVGCLCQTDLARDDLARRLSTAVGGPVHVCPGGPERVRRLGIVSGGAGGDVAKAAALGADTFLTGEAPHWAYTLAEEEGVNLLLGGHYATETFGVKALAAKAADQFGIPWRFLDHPTGL